ncbi:alpha/beta fold hydrolase [Sciscionella marina]|uniref:alpha/beta fold hydrolase n=1 Tax=Sciscionella marina TaxID=508770 RepID=UPI000374DBB1|nr:alpha/beta hydrolase [Sciscionella marina]
MTAGAAKAARSVFTVPTALGEIAVHLREHPVAEQGAVLLLHANPGDSRDFDAVVEDLVREWTVVTLDWPGYGGSTVTEPDRVTADGLVEVAEDVLDVLAERGIVRLSVLGNSVGGYVAARLAQRRPAVITGVVLVDPGGFTPHNPLTRFFCRHVMGRPRLARALVTPLMRANLGRLRTPSARASYARARAIRRDRRRLAVHCAIWRSFSDPRFDLTDSALSAPALLVWGRRDPVLPAAIDGRRARRALPDAQSVLLATSHEPFNERPHDFLEHVLPFLRQHTMNTAGVDDEVG